MTTVKSEGYVCLSPGSVICGHPASMLTFSDPSSNRSVQLTNCEDRVCSLRERVVVTIEIPEPPAEKEICWSGDMDDDCVARWNGLLLHAECMDRENAFWWWGVTDEKDHNQIDSSNNYDRLVMTGEEARRLAEEAARKERSHGAV